MPSFVPLPQQSHTIEVELILAQMFGDLDDPGDPVFRILHTLWTYTFCANIQNIKTFCVENSVQTVPQAKHQKYKSILQGLHTTTVRVMFTVECFQDVWELCYTAVITVSLLLGRWFKQRMASQFMHSFVDRTGPDPNNMQFCENILCFHKIYASFSPLIRTSCY